MLPAQGDGWAPWPFHHDEPFGKPDRVTALWTDAVANTAGQPPVRGFGGRLMFYEGRSDTPVKVEGTLVVYAFDETDRDPNNAKPDCKYVITAEQLPKHYSKSKAGHSYSVWIPWDLAGGMQKEITLIVRLEPKEGSPVIGDQCREVLPGRLPPPLPNSMIPLPAQGGPAGAIARNPAGYGGGEWRGASPAGYQQAGQVAEGVRQISYEQPQPQSVVASNLDVRDRRMKTATITVPDGLALRQTLTAPQVATPPATAQPLRWQPAGAEPGDVAGRESDVAECPRAGTRVCLSAKPAAPEPVAAIRLSTSSTAGGPGRTGRQAKSRSLSVATTPHGTVLRSHGSTLGGEPQRGAGRIAKRAALFELTWLRQAPRMALRRTLSAAQLATPPERQNGWRERRDLPACRTGRTRARHHNLVINITDRRLKPDDALGQVAIVLRGNDTPQDNRVTHRLHHRRRTPMQRRELRQISRNRRGDLAGRRNPRGESDRDLRADRGGVGVVPGHASVAPHAVLPHAVGPVAAHATHAAEPAQAGHATHAAHATHGRHAVHAAIARSRLTVHIGRIDADEAFLRLLGVCATKPPF